LSQIEYVHRSTPPIYALPLPRTITQARALHQRLLDDGAVHFLVSQGNRDVGLPTAELTSTAPRLCPNARPYIGPTATDPTVRGQGIGSCSRSDVPSAIPSETHFMTTQMIDDRRDSLLARHASSKGSGSAR
jgi:hypothetical protein